MLQEVQYLWGGVLCQRECEISFNELNNPEKLFPNKTSIELRVGKAQQPKLFIMLTILGSSTFICGNCCKCLQPMQVDSETLVAGRWMW